MGYMTEILRQIFFTEKCENFCFEVCTFSFLYDLITKKPRKLETAESNISMENFPSSLSLSVLVGVSFLPVHILSFALSLSHSLTSIDAALQRLLCVVMSSSITLTSRLFNQAEASLNKHRLATAAANRSPAV